MARITSSAVNRALKKAGLDLEIVRGEGYWYFVGPGTERWFQSSVYVPYIYQLSVEQWVDQAKTFKEAADARDAFLNEGK